MKLPRFLLLALSLVAFASLLVPNLWTTSQALNPIPVTEKLKPRFQADRTVKQGQIINVTVINPSPRHTPLKATFAGRTAKLFKQADGRYLGLLAVKINQGVGKKTLNVFDTNGKSIHQATVTIQSGLYRRQNIRVSKSVGGIQPQPGELATVGKLKRTVTPTRYWFQPFQRPTTDCMNSKFGNLRYHNGKFTGQYHKGIDLRSPAWRPVIATAGGTVQIARKFRLHGGTVGLDHGQGVTSIYIHLSKILVKPGQRVSKGDMIGRVGSTGFATGPHLHFGLFINGLPINPTQLIHGIPRC